jgi:hypothetical protein
LSISIKNDLSYYQKQQHHQHQHQEQEQPNVQSMLHSESLHALRPSSLYSGPKRMHNDVGFSPGTSPPAAVKKRKADESHSNNSCCISSLHDNFYPDNNNSFDSLAYNVSPRMTPIASKKRRKLEEESQDKDQDGLALFGPIPTLQSFSSVLDSSTASSSSSSFIDNNPPITCFDFDEEVINDDDDDNNNILDDELIFQELKWITNASNTSTNNSLPLSPPLSPSAQDSLDIQEDLDDFVLFPSL